MRSLPMPSYPNRVETATVMAVKCLKHLQQATAAGMFMPLLPFERIASVTSLALRFNKRLGSSVPDSTSTLVGWSIDTAPSFDKFAKSLVRIKLNTSCPFKHTLCRDAASSSAISACREENQLVSRGKSILLLT
jgi:hypothetical protein